MFDQDAIKALQEGQSIDAANQAVTRALRGDNPTAVAALPDDYKHIDLEDYMPSRRRARGKMVTQSLPAFAAYTQAHTENGATVFVDSQRMRATAVLNLGTPDAPGHADNTAVLESAMTAPYQALLAATCQSLGQKSAAEFLEDWAHLITCYQDTDTVPVPRVVAAVRKLTIEGLRRVESEEQSLSATRSTFESVAAKSKDPLPTHIYFACQPYADLQKRTFVLRFGVLTTDDKPTLRLRIVKAEEHREAMGQELAGRISDAFAGHPVQVVLGQYAKQ